MYLTNKLSVVIFFSILFSKVFCEQQCCKNNGTIKDSRRCKDNSSVSILCKEYPIMLNPDWGVYNQFLIGSDDDGEYLDAYIAGYLIREPYFCSGPLHFASSNKTTNVAITCSSYREWYHDQGLNGSVEAREEARMIRIYNVISFLLNAGSAVSFLTIAAIYHFLPEVQDLQGTCYFHFTLIAGLAHLTILYMELFETDGLLPNLCITNLYVMIYFLLCGFMWMGVVSFNTWKHARNIISEDEEKLKKKYKIFAYGTPLALLFCCWIHVHLQHTSNFEFVLACFEHQIVVLEFYVAIPVLLTLLANFIMFIDAQIQIWNLHAVQLRDRKLMLKIIKYRFFMNAKLFFVMGVPWALFLSYNLMMAFFVFERSMKFIEVILTFLLFGEGMPIFAVLVIFRKRVLRGMANRWFTNTNVFPDRWKTMKDSETEEEDEEEGEGTSNNVQVRYNIQDTDEDKTNHNPLPIITF